ncbi:DNA alkylation repair protein [Pigmentiphaga aceris]|uniref:DNA alkylation repair protein n=1 Tax=Pigmentiphaga aceris TaxID=1940612 RepID=A0A5C0B655_9BURK|nr:DNA alkylation repair protein [Pigmentiphaga aceris]QEI08860.1 DNA alkylation repair protein [Pigmentiphaga aceris]
MATSEIVTQAPELKHIFDPDRIRHIADETLAVYPDFDRDRFVQLCLSGLDDLSLMQRLRRVSEALHATLPRDYRAALTILRALAPRLNSGFVSIALPEFVALYGADDVEASLDALEFFTRFGSSEFAIRHFLRRDLDGTLAVMKQWSVHENEHVRRLASEGCRPRLPWSFRLEPLMRDPSPVAEILENLKADPSLYVRKSVANHLNDITKNNPDWVLDRLGGWPQDNPHTTWIVRHGLRSLIKEGDKRALALIGAGAKADVEVRSFTVTPAAIHLGETIDLALQIVSTSSKPQRLVIDYAIHYVKKSGTSSAKVFKLKAITLGAGGTVTLTRAQRIRSFTTRVHYAGRHEVEIFVNGECLARSAFALTV